MKQIAFAKVILPDQEELLREVVVFNDKGLAISHFPLLKEIAFTEWRNETFIWPFQTDI